MDKKDWTPEELELKEALNKNVNRIYIYSTYLNSEILL